MLIDEGVYNESVVVETDNIVIRGVDRQTVVLDGEHSEEMANGIIVFSNGVAVENLPAKISEQRVLHRRLRLGSSSRTPGRLSTP